MNTSNPAMGVLDKAASGAYNFGGVGEVATVRGATTKAILLVALTFVVGYFSMLYSFGYMFQNGATPKALLIGSVIVSVIIAFVTIFKPQYSNFTAPAYAVAEGVALGCISATFELKYPGIVSTAVMSTFVVVLSMLALWKFKVIVPTARFRAVITGAVVGVAILYTLNILLSLFGFRLLPDSGPISIIISLIVCTIAAFSLVLDFEMIGSCVEEHELPKYFESYCAFSLLVTICWLYLEILKLLSKRE
ncbi:Bax inhibitor-1/YccA family protein [uncultured Anaerobiospirillum sp.]|uniref:Bax inhibitor-1/YccA family protein n=1 Tax=uncultured Anaerobiospirillum sp. TaxID=265728 RepID=UPI0028046040|nr:Bax inhibitor-1/YccA family protein [uncultured Anaerobiospirillum sp.]